MSSIVQSTKCKVQNKGFTLIELLVVISIIGILATLLISRYGMAEKSARDTQRKSDLNQYRNALENFAVKSGGVYPIRETVSDASDSTIEPCKSLIVGYLSQCSQDPRQVPEECVLATDYCYRYLSDEGGLNYLLWAKMEAVDYWYLCANGKSGAKTTSPADSDCW